MHTFTKITAMHHFNRTMLFLLLMAATFTTCLAQRKAVKMEKKVPADDVHKEPLRTDGLKKMTDNANRNLNVDIQIDEEVALNDIELSISKAMQEVEVALENSEINFDPIEIHLDDLHMDLERMEVTIPDLDIHIDPIEINFDHFHGDSNMDEDEDDDNDNVREELITEEEKIQEKSHSTNMVTTQKGQQKNKASKKEKSEKIKRPNANQPH